MPAGRLQQSWLCSGCHLHKHILRRNLKEVLENDPEAYYNSDELLEPLKLMYRSLMTTNDDGIANGRLLDVIRQVCPDWLGRPPPHCSVLAPEIRLSNHQPATDKVFTLLAGLLNRPASRSVCVITLFVSEELVCAKLLQLSLAVSKPASRSAP